MSNALNPFKGRQQFTDAHGAPVVDNFRLGDRAERAVSSLGENQRIEQDRSDAEHA